ncbi:sulfurtransferase-like selenium metabolism protein YedF [Geobacter hydrogenophilus]|uniref:Selenium metabolism protein YedF n=1 Tax=Geobacter hydrogenophilus TaxID=40983 RepID=A0A9W6FXR0_9BACT|nr:sulfurtransferase-like selenium metabolism protein YedF [Geobacter hydrogenophilus]MBT0895124.1 sulfurtransferase-like selenium metabolism protein YedF [Geobacter hydrogenophilus]GLI36949.1 selenium metabolism protein YedF [Geobacter hydrogenophilus]
MKIIDCRNMACPAPVVTTKRALEEAGGEAVQVLVDPGAPRENVTRFAENRGFAVSEAETDNGFTLTITSPGSAPAVPVRTVADRGGKSVILVASDRLGDGPEELGRLLMKNFIITLLDLAELPDRMLFVNTGVLLTTEGSEVLEALESLGNRGVEVLSCGVCLDFFHRKDKLVAGSVTNMFTIAESLMGAGSVVRL